jgi:hypothetical protein
MLKQNSVRECVCDSQKENVKISYKASTWIKRDYWFKDVKENIPKW